MRIPQILICIALITAPAVCLYAQRDSSVYLSKKGLNNLLNNKFSSIVTGQTNNSTISNFASFDPLDGSFSFKGSFGVGQNDTLAKISYLSFKIEGDLLSNSYGALFKNAKLNTGALLDFQYHLRLRKGSGVKYLSSDRSALHLQQLVDSTAFAVAVENLFLEERTRGAFLQTQRTKFQLDSLELISTRRKLDSVASVRTTLPVVPANYDTLKKVNQYADSVLNKLTALQKDSMATKNIIDSTSYVANNSLTLRQSAKRKLNIAYRNKALEKELNAPVSAISISWLTITAGLSQKDYYTYDPTGGFSESINKKELGSFRIGLTGNYYKQYAYPSKGAFFINAGFLRSKDNNASLFSTTDINQEVAVKNAGGDTTSKITKKYSVYTDPITEAKSWSLFLNFYLISLNNSTALHI
jgi:hypothetical protein